MLPDIIITDSIAVPNTVNPDLIAKTMVNRHRRPEDNHFSDFWVVRGEVDGKPVVQQGYIDHRGSKCTLIDWV